MKTINGTQTAYGYTYDQDGRLTDVTVNGSAYSHYGYDTNGNRTSYTGPSGSVSGTYDAQDRMLTYGNFSYTYTANGELASKTDSTTGQVTAYSYDVLGNLRQVVLPDGTNIQYLIDGRNRRVGKEVNGTLTQAWLYDGQLRPVAELDGAGNVVSTFIYATHVNVPDYMVKGGVTYRIITDQLGSPRFVIDPATGTIAQRLDYDEFGNVLLDTNPGFQPFGFAGGMYDSQTGLVRFGARDYDAQSGRWTSKDPLGFGGHQSNIFEYSLCDPINRTDLLGRQGWEEFVGIGLVALALWYGVAPYFESPPEPLQQRIGVKQGCGTNAGGASCHSANVPVVLGKVPPALQWPGYQYNVPHSLEAPYNQDPFYTYTQPNAGSPSPFAPEMPHLDSPQGKLPPNTAPCPP